MPQGPALFSLSLAQFTADSRALNKSFFIWRQTLKTKYLIHSSIIKPKFYGDDNLGNNKISIKPHMTKIYWNVIFLARNHLGVENVC